MNLNVYNDKGEKHGLWERYHRNNENGQLWYSGHYINGKRVGMWVWYFDNGQLSSIGNCTNGEYIGYWVYYDRDGTIRNELFYL